MIYNDGYMQAALNQCLVVLHAHHFLILTFLIFFSVDLWSVLSVCNVNLP